MGTRSGSTLPAESLAKATATMRARKRGGRRGKRTGIDIDDAGGDMEAMFASARTPETNHNTTASRNRRNTSSTGSPRGRKKRRAPLTSSRRASSRPNMGLPGSRRGDDEDDDEVDLDRSTTSDGSSRKSTGKRVRYSVKAKRNNNKRISFSPSELSSVSTAPPTPRDPEMEEDEDEGFENHMDDYQEEDLEQHSPTQHDSSSSSNDNTDSETREPFPTPRSDGQFLDAEEDAEEDLEIAHGQSNRRRGVQPMDDDDSNPYPEQERESSSKRGLGEENGDGTADTEDDDEGDLLPPNPPEESSPEVDTPTTVPKSNEKRSGAYDASDDDEDKEGDGFQIFDGDEEDANIVHDPETPASTRKKRADLERLEIEEEAYKERKKKNKTKGGKPRKKDSDNSSSSENEDESQTYRKKTPKTKKKTRFAPAVSPAGYPSDNRGYEVQPIETFAPEGPTNGLRRSSRAKYKPLEHWRNEKPIYVKNDAVNRYGDMPIVSGIQKALPTPHKKRAVKKGDKMKKKKHVESSRNASKSASRHHDEYDDEDDEIEFNYRSLGRQGKIIEDETACIWDDGADDTIDTSKYLQNLIGIVSTTSS